MTKQAKFDYKVKKSSFKKVLLVDYIKSVEESKYITNEASMNGVRDSFDMLVSVRSLEGMTTEIIDNIDNRIEYFQIKSWQHFLSDNVHKKGDAFDENGGIFESREDYCESCCIYTREELRQIISKIEQIEKGTENLDDFAKLVTIYDRLKRNISYDYELNDKASLYTRSLRGLVTGKTVCAGYATMLQHILQRQGIECKFCSGTTASGGAHAWNVVELNGKQYGLDLTWDSRDYHNGQYGIKSMKYFGGDVARFNESHKVNNNVGNSNYSQLSEFEKDKLNVGVNMSFSELQRQHDFGINCHYVTAKDGSKYYIAEVGSVEFEDPLRNNQGVAYKYILVPIIDNKLDFSKKGLFYSCTSYSELKNRLDYSKTMKKDDKESQKYLNLIKSFADNVLSIANRVECGKRGSCFLGAVFYDDKTSSVKYQNPIAIQDLPVFSIQNVRMLGDCVVDKSEKNGLIKYNKYLLNTKNGAMEQKSFYAETDLFTLPKNIVENLLDSAKLDLIITEDGGYLGKIAQDGQIIQNPQYLMSARNSSGIKTM